MDLAGAQLALGKIHRGQLGPQLPCPVVATECDGKTLIRVNLVYPTTPVPRLSQRWLA